MRPRNSPDPSVRLERELVGALPEQFEAVEQRLVAHARQAPVEERRLHGENHTALGVVLVLHDGCVADTHWSVAAIAGERRPPSTSAPT